MTKKSGGHVLECKTKDVVVDIDYITDFELDLPENEDFNSADLEK